MNVLITIGNTSHRLNTNIGLEDMIASMSSTMVMYGLNESIVASLIRIIGV